MILLSCTWRPTEVLILRGLTSVGVLCANTEARDMLKGRNDREKHYVSKEEEWLPSEANEGRSMDWIYQIHTVDGRNPAPVDIVNVCKYPIIYRVLAPSQVVGLGIFEPSTVGLQIHSVSHFLVLENPWWPLVVVGCFPRRRRRRTKVESWARTESERLDFPKMMGLGKGGSSLKYMAI